MQMNNLEIIDKTKISFVLYGHPTTPVTWVKRVLVECFQVQEGLVLHYQVIADTQFLLIPAMCSSDQVDGLWSHTCCEAFIAEPYGSGYRELNLSPSGQWQLYQFSSYREGRVQLNVPPPKITRIVEPDMFTLTAHIPNLWLPRSQGSALRLGLSLVLEDQDGKIYYLALNHSSGVPNFHCADTWTGKLLVV